MKKTLIAMLLAAALVFSLAGCAAGRPAASQTPAAETQPAPTETAEAQPAPAETAEVQPEPVETPAPVAAPARQVGERFEDTIIMQGMEETVHYEHIRNEALGIEMDYDYEMFSRESGADRERFVCAWDDPANIENYLELTSSPEDADTAAAAIAEELAKDCEVYWDSRELDRAGSCIHLDASVIKGTNQMADQLQAVYILPAPDGCRIAWEHYFVTESEGFARRFGYMLDTLTLIEK